MRAAADAAAKEALGHIYRAMLQTPEFTLKDGTKCRVTPLSEPEMDSGGELKCGFDVALGDRGHLEFTVTNTGWGRSFARAELLKPQGKKPGRER